MSEPSAADVRVLIVVDSWDGHTRRAAEAVAEGVRREGATATLRTSDAATREDVRSHDALVTGSAVHQRTMTWRMKRFIDEVCEPVWFYDEVVGRAGAVFTTGGGHGKNGAGCEMTEIALMANLAACGMVLVPMPKCTPGFETAGMHWGPTLKGTDDGMHPIPAEDLADEKLEGFHHHGRNIARVAARLKGVELVTGNPWPDERTVEGRRQGEEKAGITPDQRQRHMADPGEMTMATMP